MYPNISPNLNVKQTISNPTNPVEVIGFTARNIKLGQSAIVMKDNALHHRDGELLVAVPIEQAESLKEKDSELAVLANEEVLMMTGSDFSTEARLRGFEGGGQAAQMMTVSINNGLFRSFPEDEVPVGN
jgi:hypothetical protein